MANTLRTDTLSTPLGRATAASVDIDTGAGNLTVDALPVGDPVLARGTLQYFEKQGVPAKSIGSEGGRAILTLRGGRGLGHPWFRFPWAACNGAAEWHVHLNPAVPSAITAHTGGGNVRLDLAAMAVTRLAADSGGGNLDVVLPDHAANLRVAAKTGGGNVTVAIGRGIAGSNAVDAGSGAGNVVVRVPSGVAARVRATSGLGRVTVDPRFSKIAADTYQSPDYDEAVDKVEIEARSGAGNVRVAAE
jgi:hypothetical protein